MSPERGSPSNCCRSKRKFDDKIREYIAEHPRASVVSLAAGRDTTFYRVDNGTIRWYDLDLPAVIEIRRQLLPEPERVTYIAKFLLDPSWFEDVDAQNGIFMIAGGVLQYFEESEMKQFFSMLADNFPDGEIIFDAQSRLDTDIGAWTNVIRPEQQDAMRSAWAKAWLDGLKDWWEKAPQDQRDEVYNTITELKISTKPTGKEWADIEAWWNQLSDKKRGEALSDFMISSSKGARKWVLENASEITKWDSRITVIDQFPLYRNIPRDLLSAEIRRLMDCSDESNMFTIIHLRV